MSRVETGSVTFSDTTTLNQLRTTKGRVLAVALKPRLGNTGTVYAGTDTGLTTSNGFALLPGDREDWSFTGSHDATVFRMLATDSGDVLDWAMEMES